MMDLLRDNIGARKKARRVGRGHSSGWGKTSGRGHKGQKARSGCSIKGFEGGQMPFYRRVPKRIGFNGYKPAYTALDLKRLESLLFRELIDDSKPLSYEVLLNLGLADKRKKVKLLGNTPLSKPITIEVHAASKSALEAIDKSKGTVTIISSPQSEEEEKDS